MPKLNGGLEALELYSLMSYHVLFIIIDQIYRIKYIWRKELYK